MRGVLSIQYRFSIEPSLPFEAAKEERPNYYLCKEHVPLPDKQELSEPVPVPPFEIEAAEASRPRNKSGIFAKYVYISACVAFCAPNFADRYREAYNIPHNPVTIFLH